MKHLLRIKTIVSHLKDTNMSISFRPDDFGITRYVSHTSKLGEELNELLCEDLIEEGFINMPNVLTLKDEGVIKDVIMGEYDSFGILSLVVKFDDKTGMVIC